MVALQFLVLSVVVRVRLGQQEAASGVIPDCGFLLFAALLNLWGLWFGSVPVLTQRNNQVLKSRMFNALRIEYFGASGNLSAKIEIFSIPRNALFFSVLRLQVV